MKNLPKKLLVGALVLLTALSCVACTKKPKFKRIKEELAVKVAAEEDLGIFLAENNFEEDLVSEEDADEFLSFLAENLKNASSDYVMDVLVDLVAQDFDITGEMDDTIVHVLKKEHELWVVANFLEYLEKSDWLVYHRSAHIKTAMQAYYTEKYSDLLDNNFLLAITYYKDVTKAFASLDYYDLQLPRLSYSALLGYLNPRKEAIYTEKGLGGYYDGEEDKAAPTTEQEKKGAYSYYTHHGDFKYLYEQTEHYNFRYEIEYEVKISVYFRGLLITKCASLDGEWYKVGDYLYNVQAGKNGVKTLIIYSAGTNNYVESKNVELI